jgi:hypothetical protein
MNRMKQKSQQLLCAAAAIVALSSAGCGYHTAGSAAPTLPPTVKTICIPAFANGTARYRLTERLPAAITREFISRTKYRVVEDPGKADAVLDGVVNNYSAYPTVYDPVTGRNSAVQVTVNLSVTLRDRAGAVLFRRENFEVRERYEISVDPKTYFEESDVAIDRVSREVARTVVSAVLENF